VVAASRQRNLEGQLDGVPKQEARRVGVHLVDDLPVGTASSVYYIQQDMGCGGELPIGQHPRFNAVLGQAKGYAADRV
jgi:hypothetical protein